MDLEVVHSMQMTTEELNVLYRGIASSDPPEIPPREYSPLRLAFRDPSGCIIAGIDGFTAWRWLKVEGLWVDSPLRGRGLGSRLMVRAEEEARSRGCEEAGLATFDFQARRFYERLGYRVWAQLEGYPAGHAHLQLRKSLGNTP